MILDFVKRYGFKRLASDEWYKHITPDSTIRVKIKGDYIDITFKMRIGEPNTEAVFAERRLQIPSCYADVEDFIKNAILTSIREVCYFVLFNENPL